MHRSRDLQDSESPYWWREFEEVYWTNQFYQSPLRRPTGVKVKYMAEPIEGRICYACGSFGHRKEDCEFLAKGGTCDHCRDLHHADMCWRLRKELDSRLWEDGMAFPEDLPPGQRRQKEMIEQK